MFELVNSGTVATPKYTSNLTMLAAFESTDGKTPFSGVTLDAAGDLVGTMYAGGSNNAGTAYEIKNTGTLTALTFDSAGNLYGTTSSGGSPGNGTVFKITNTGTAIAPVYGSTTAIANFGTTTGAGPVGGVVINSQGDVFGTTGNASANGQGTLFELIPSGSATPVVVTAPEPGSLLLLLSALGPFSAILGRARKRGA